MNKFPINLKRCFSCKKSRYHGNRVEENYTLLEQIGHGKTAKIYTGEHKLTHEKVAIKIINQSYLITPSRIEALDREIQILKCIRHPNIISVKEIYRDHEEVAIVTELANGGDFLLRIVHPEYILSEYKISIIVSQIASALEYLHSKGITHRDVKLGNIMFFSSCQDSIIKLLDFGTAIKGKTNKSDIYGMVGTFNFMAPEAFSEKDGYSSKVDLWSLGVILYIMMFGSYPFEAKFTSQLENKIKSGEYIIPEEFQMEVGLEARDLLSRLLEVNPERRITAKGVLNHPWIRLNKNRNQKINPKVLDNLRSLLQVQQQGMETCTNAKLNLDEVEIIK